MKFYKNYFDKDSLHEGRVLLINKPFGWTSFDVIKKLRGILKIRKIGHAGTLDPYATGLLIICTGKKTKHISQYQDLDKVYRGEILIGKTTPSYDLETNFDSENSYSHISENDIYLSVQKFTGPIAQFPPMYSAIKVRGERLYKLARRGVEVEIPKRFVIIYKFDILNINLPKINFEIRCSKGTYIRSLASDFGKELGVGACLSSLERTKIGDNKIKDSYTLEELSTLFSATK